jgi:carbohydrate esterase-like sialic acid-specific acetylesterase
MLDLLIASAVLHLIIGGGQSNADGGGAFPALSITAEYPQDALMFIGGELAGRHDNDPTIAVQPSALASFVPLLEGNLETPGSQIAWTIQDLAKRDGVDYKTVSVQLGVGGQPFATIQKGTQSYANMLMAVQACVDNAAKLGATCQVDAVTWIHGETDFSIGTTLAQYKTDLVQLIDDLNLDIPPITKQSTPITLFLNQLSNWNYNGSTSDPRIDPAQLEAANENLGRIVMVGPTYAEQYNPLPSSIHLTANGERMLGEYFGRAIYQRIIQNRDFAPLGPISAQVLEGDQTISVHFKVPVAPLTFVSTLVTSPN